MPDTIKLTMQINDEFSVTLNGSDIGELIGRMADLAGSYNEGYVGGAGFILADAILQSDGANPLLTAAAFAYRYHEIEPDYVGGQGWILAIDDRLMVEGKDHVDVWSYTQAKEKMTKPAQQ